MFVIIPTFENYEINENGEIRERGSKKAIVPFMKNGYPFVILKKGINSYVLEEVSIHQLLGLAFLDRKEEDKEIIHINGLKKDNRIENLRWITTQEKKDINKEKYQMRREIRTRLMEHFPILEKSWYDDLIPFLLIIQARESKYQFGIQINYYELRRDCLQAIMEDIYKIVKKFYFEKRGIQNE